MSDGSSQGLFVIVAVVIFGIFVLISYVLFKDNLKPSLASIFNDSITETENKLKGYFIYKEEKVSLKNELDIEKILPHQFNSSSTFKNIEYKGTGISYYVNVVNKHPSLGIILPKHNDIVSGERFLVSFTIEMLSGSATTLGGHINGFGSVDTIYVNELTLNRNWQSNLPFTLEEGNTYNVSFFIDILPDIDDDPNFYIQVDRLVAGTSHEYNILDIKFQKVLERGGLLNDKWK